MPYKQDAPKNTATLIYNSFLAEVRVKMIKNYSLDLDFY